MNGTHFYDFWGKPHFIINKMLLLSVRNIHLNEVRKNKTCVKDVEELKWTGVCDKNVDDEKPLWIYLCVSI